MWLTILLFVAFLFYWYGVRPMKYWKKKGVPHQTPVPFFGNALSVVLQKESQFEKNSSLYKQFPEHRYFGIYQFHVPALFIRDPELVKQIAIKDFDHFADKLPNSSKVSDPLWVNNLLNQTGAKWRGLRSKLSPNFTGSKMRTMFVLMEECVKSFTSFFEEKNEDVVELDMKDTLSRFANDVIGTCAFGVQSDSLREPNNEFYLNGIEATDLSGIKIFKLFGYAIYPNLMRLLNVQMFSKKVGDYFRKLVKDLIEYRQQQGVVRPDMIHLLLEARKTDRFGVLSTHDELTAQALTFFFAGFDTTSTAMTFLTYELAINPDIQERLREEIEEVLEKHNGAMNYDSLNEMKYLDMVVTESLRKWPAVPHVMRTAFNDFVIEPTLPHEKPLCIEKDTLVWIGTSSIMRDPKYYPDPEKFMPERFSEENKHTIEPHWYLPFGIGPRNCIGSRFALMEMKILTAELVRKFEIVPTANTLIPMEYSPKHTLAAPKGGLKLGLKKRNVS